MIRNNSRLKALVAGACGALLVPALAIGARAATPAASSERDATVTQVVNLPWPFCLRYNGQPYQNMTVYAPDPNSAALSFAQTVRLFNDAAVATGYPPLFSGTAGPC